jgi:histidine triad (HIT) family protein
MSDDCIFCAIAAGEQPAHVVYEGDDAVAFLDANPLARGHTLVVPRDHHERIQDTPAETARALFSAVHELVPTVEAAVDADATNVGFNNGPVAGQVVDHVHCHVVPRFEGDGGRPIHAVAASQENLSDEELAAIAEDVRAAD